MQVTELRIKRNKLRIEIANSIAKFHRETGVLPSVVQALFVEVTELGGAERRVLSRVEVELKL